MLKRREKIMVTKECIKVSDLMNKDLFRYGGHFCRFVIRAMDAVIERLSDGSLFSPCAYAEAKPIPLTESFLVANGFDKDVVSVICDDYSLMLSGVDILVRVTNSQYYYLEISCFKGTKLKMNIHFVHEFQHALRLCGLTELADGLKI